MFHPHVSPFCLPSASIERFEDKADMDSEPYLERDDPEVDQIKETLHKVVSKEDTVGEIGVFPVRE